MTSNLIGSIKNSHMNTASDGKLNALNLPVAKLPNNIHAAQSIDEKRENARRRLALNMVSFFKKVFEINKSDITDGIANPNKPIIAPVSALKTFSAIKNETNPPNNDTICIPAMIFLKDGKLIFFRRL